jgi:hypothetical protein
MLTYHANVQRKSQWQKFGFFTVARKNYFYLFYQKQQIFFMELIDDIPIPQGLPDLYEKPAII